MDLHDPEPAKHLSSILQCYFEYYRYHAVWHHKLYLTYKIRLFVIPTWWWCSLNILIAKCSGTVAVADLSDAIWPTARSYLLARSGTPCPNCGSSDSQGDSHLSLLSLCWTWSRLVKHCFANTVWQLLLVEVESNVLKQNKKQSIMFGMGQCVAIS